MDSAEDKPAAPSWVGKRTPTFYCLIRPTAAYAKLAGAFPLQHVLRPDGRALRFRWFSLINLVDLLTGCFNLVYFMYSCSELLEHMEESGRDDSPRAWLIITCYMTMLRSLVIFIAVRYSAAKLPALFTAIEEYHQELGSPLIRNYFPNWKIILIALTKVSLSVLMMEITSYFYFSQMEGESLQFKVLPVAILYLGNSMWRALPLNIFVIICRYLQQRFLEVRDALAHMRKETATIKEDISTELETLRSQYTALVKIVNILEVGKSAAMFPWESSYGLLLTVNLFFMLFDIVLQLFLFFVVTRSSNWLLLVLSSYFFFMCLVLLAFVEKLERSDEKILREVSAFGLCSASRDQQMQLQMFATLLSSHPTKLSASGFVNVNNSLIVTLLGAMATYIVMMVQFEPYFRHYFANITLPNFDF